MDFSPQEQPKDSKKTIFIVLGLFFIMILLFVLFRFGILIYFNNTTAQVLEDTLLDFHSAGLAQYLLEGEVTTVLDAEITLNQKKEVALKRINDFKLNGEITYPYFHNETFHVVNNTPLSITFIE